MEPKYKVLLVTSSGGGGLLQAAKAKEHEIIDSKPNAIILEKDVMKHWVWRPIGRLFVFLYNGAQRRGDVWTQSFFAGPGIHIAEWIFWPQVFFCSLYTLFKEKVDRVIDTQAFATSAILKAIRIYNRWCGTKIVLEKVLVDFPTKKATHYFIPIRALSSNDRKFFRLLTLAPLLHEGETEEEFWSKNCGLTKNELQYEECYVRRAFRKYRDPLAKPNQLLVRVKSDEERRTIKKIASQGSLPLVDFPDGIQCNVDSDVCVITLLLGSQPASNATLEYIQKMAAIAHLNPNRKICFFVFAAEFKTAGDGLFGRILTWFGAQKNFPKNLTLIPMSFQQDDVIAPLFARSDATCTRSGGQTAMELMSVSRGKMWIHSEAKGSILDRAALLKGIPGWESENAVYLEKARGASFVTPETITPFLQELLIPLVTQKSAARWD